MEIEIDKIISFIQKHEHEDVIKLRLKKFHDPDINISFAIDQIEARQKIKNKLPLWEQNKQLLFPSVLSAEQASSEETARYKRSLLQGKYGLICDLTGGLGIDSYYLSLCAEKTTYVERFPFYCEIAAHNFKTLNCENIEIVNGDSRDFVLNKDVMFDAFYIDPARRTSENKRLYALQDCEPDIVGLQDILFTKSPVILLKASPMIDIARALQELKHVAEIHVISVKNECKELFFIMDKQKSIDKIAVYCINLLGSNGVEKYLFYTEEERLLSQPEPATSVLSYLYEPNTSVLKAGGFKSVTESYNIRKLHKSSHLYTSDEYINGFPGRKFKVKEILPFSGKSLKMLSKIYPSGNITVRNMPVSVEELRKKTKVKDGGDTYIFATTLHPEKKVIIICDKYS